MRNRKAIGLVVAGLVAGLTVGSIGIATATSTSATSTASTSTTSAATGRGAPDGDHVGRGPGGGIIGKPGFGGEGDLSEALAKLSGLTVDQVNTKRAAGKSYADIAKAEGVSTTALIAETVRIEQQECDDAVKAGTITSAERTKVMTGIEARLKTEIARTDAPGGPHGPRGPHGPGAPSSQDGTTGSSSTQSTSGTSQ